MDTDNHGCETKIILRRKGLNRIAALQTHVRECLAQICEIRVSVPINVLLWDYSKLNSLEIPRFFPISDGVVEGLGLEAGVVGVKVHYCRTKGFLRQGRLFK